MTDLLAAVPLLETDGGVSWLVIAVLAVILLPLLILWNRAHVQKKRDAGEDIDDGGGSAAAM